MTALCDRPNLTCDELSHILSLAVPSLELLWNRCSNGLKSRITFRISFQKYSDKLWVFFNYYPNASPSNRWSVTHEGKIGAPWRDVDFFIKRTSKRFPSLLEAITYYEMEIKK